jgi:hypothetical protein
MLMAKAGFRRIASPEAGATADPRPLFELKFRQKNSTEAEKKTIQILDEYMRGYGEFAREGPDSQSVAQ